MEGAIGAGGCIAVMNGPSLDGARDGVAEDVRTLRDDREDRLKH